MYGERPKFDLSLIGEADKRNLCSTFLEAINRFYENPENIRKFEAWKAAQATPEMRTDA